MSAIKVTADQFESEIQGSPLVLVDFWAEWCAPCRQLIPQLDAAAEELGSFARVTKVNIDEHPDLATRFGVRAVPTLIMFQDGEVADTKFGAMTKQQIVDWVKSI